MLKILGVLVILVAIAGIVAFSQGWIQFSRSETDPSKITITADPNKAKADIKADIDKAKEVISPSK
jgi:hypothetical protein